VRVFIHDRLEGWPVFEHKLRVGAPELVLSGRWTKTDSSSETHLLCCRRINPSKKFSVRIDRTSYVPPVSHQLCSLFGSSR